MTKLFESLHNHTILSDGTQTHLDMLATAQAAGYGIIAFTDHDRLPDDGILEQLKNYDGPMKWLVGIELSASLPEELGGAREGFVHLLSPFIDARHPALLAHCEAMRQGRLDRVKFMLAHVNTLGLKATLDDCLGQTGAEVVGQLHLVKAVLKYPENIQLMDQWQAEIARDAEHDEVAAARLDGLKGVDNIQRAFNLFMKSSSYKPMPKEDTARTVLDVDRSVELLRQAGGVAILAHWFTKREHITPEILEQWLLDRRIDGLETDVIEIGGRPDEIVEADAKFLGELAEKHHALIEVGIDAHYAEQFEAFTHTPAAQRSIGQTSRLIEAAKPDLMHSNL